MESRNRRSVRERKKGADTKKQMIESRGGEERARCRGGRKRALFGLMGKEEHEGSEKRQNNPR